MRPYLGRLLIAVGGISLLTMILSHAPVHWLAGFVEGAAVLLLLLLWLIEQRGK